jgi:hypothetical protein
MIEIVSQFTRASGFYLPEAARSTRPPKSIIVDTGVVMLMLESTSEARSMYGSVSISNFRCRALSLTKLSLLSQTSLQGL